MNFAEVAGIPVLSWVKRDNTDPPILNGTSHADY